MRLNYRRVAFVALPAIVFYFGMGIVTNLVFFPYPVDISTIETWSIIVTWPAIYAVVALILVVILCLLVFMVELLDAIFTVFARRRR